MPGEVPEIESVASGLASSPAAAPEPPTPVPVASVPATDLAAQANAPSVVPAREGVVDAEQPALDASTAPPKSVLGELLATKDAPAAKPTEEKPAEAAVEAQAAPAEVVTPAGEPIKWDYSIPETVQMDDAGRARVQDLLSKFVGNPNDKASQQALLDYHAERLLEVKGSVDKDNRQEWNKLRSDWVEEQKRDPILGGSGYETTKAAARRMLDMATQGWSAPRLQRLESLLEVTGAGDHPALLDLLKSFAKFYDEPPLPPPGNPTKDGGRKTLGKGNMRDIYRGDR